MNSEDLSDPELERTLMQMGLLTQPQLTEALEFQARIPQSQWMPIGKVLLEMELITPQQLQQARASLQATDKPVSYQAPDWDQIFDPLTGPKAAPAAPSPAPNPPAKAESPQWDSIFDDKSPTQATKAPALTNKNELDLKYLFDQAQTNTQPTPAEKPPHTPENISREPLPDLDALFNMNAPTQKPKPVSNSTLESTSSELDLSLLFNSPANAQSAPKKQSAAASDLFDFPATPAAIPQPAPATPPAQIARPTPPPMQPAPPQPIQAPPTAAAAQEDGWTVQSAWGAPKKPFVPPAPKPAFRKPTPPPTPPPASHQIHQQELNQMMAKVMGPDAQPTKKPTKPLGEILLEEKELEEWQLTHALCMQKSDIYSKQQIGAILVKMGYVAQEEIERALNTQIEP